MERCLSLLPPGKNIMQQKVSLDSGLFPFSVLTLQLSENSSATILSHSKAIFPNYSLRWQEK